MWLFAGHYLHELALTEPNYCKHHYLNNDKYISPYIYFSQVVILQTLENQLDIRSRLQMPRLQPL